MISKTKRTGKGQSILLSHAILVGFSIFLVYAITTTFVTIKNDYQKSIGGDDIKQLCFVVQGAVNKIYSETVYNVTGDTVMGVIDVKMPLRIAGMNYRTKFVNQSVVIESLDAKINETCKMGINAVYNGTTSGGLTRFYYTKQQNGQDRIEMTRI